MQKKIISFLLSLSVLWLTSVGQYGVALALDPNARPDIGGINNGGSVHWDGSTTNVNMGTGGNKSTTTIDWKNFNVGSNQTVNWDFTGHSQTALNIVRQSGGLSQIYGKLTDSCAAGSACGFDGSGKVVLINPNGVTFFNGSSVNLNSFTVSSYNASWEDFKDKGWNENDFWRLKLTNGGSAGNILVQGGADIYGRKEVVIAAPNISIQKGAVVRTDTGYNASSSGNVNDPYNVGWGNVHVFTSDGVNFDYRENGSMNTNSYAFTKDTYTPGVIDIQGTIDSGRVNIRNMSKDQNAKINITNGAVIKATKLVNGETGSIYIVAANDINIDGATIQSLNKRPQDAARSKGHGEIAIQATGNVKIANANISSAATTGSNVDRGYGNIDVKSVTKGVTISNSNLNSTSGDVLVTSGGAGDAGVINISDSTLTSQAANKDIKIQSVNSSTSIANSVLNSARNILLAAWTDNTVSGTGTSFNANNQVDIKAGYYEDGYLNNIGSNSIAGATINAPNVNIAAVQNNTLNNAKIKRNSGAASIANIIASNGSNNIVNQSDIYANNLAISAKTLNNIDNSKIKSPTINIVATNGSNSVTGGSVLDNNGSNSTTVKLDAKNGRNTVTNSTIKAVTSTFLATLDNLFTGAVVSGSQADIIAQRNNQILGGSNIAVNTANVTANTGSNTVSGSTVGNGSGITSITANAGTNTINQNSTVKGTKVNINSRANTIANSNIAAPVADIIASAGDNNITSSTIGNANSGQVQVKASGNNAISGSTLNASNAIIEASSNTIASSVINAITSSITAITGNNAIASSTVGNGSGVTTITANAGTNTINQNSYIKGTKVNVNAKANTIDSSFVVAPAADIIASAGDNTITNSTIGNGNAGQVQVKASGQNTLSNATLNASNAIIEANSNSIASSIINAVTSSVTARTGDNTIAASTIGNGSGVTTISAANGKNLINNKSVIKGTKAIANAKQNSFNDVQFVAAAADILAGAGGNDLALSTIGTGAGIVNIKSTGGNTIVNSNSKLNGTTVSLTGNNSLLENSTVKAKDYSMTANTGSNTISGSTINNGSDSESITLTAASGHNVVNKSSDLKGRNVILTALDNLVDGATLKLASLTMNATGGDNIIQNSTIADGSANMNSVTMNSVNNNKIINSTVKSNTIAMNANNPAYKNTVSNSHLYYNNLNLQGNVDLLANTTINQGDGNATITTDGNILVEGTDLKKADGSNQTNTTIRSTAKNVALKNTTLTNNNNIDIISNNGSVLLDNAKLNGIGGNVNLTAFNDFTDASFINGSTVNAGNNASIRSTGGNINFANTTLPTYGGRLALTSDTKNVNLNYNKNLDFNKVDFHAGNDVNITSSGSIAFTDSTAKNSKNVNIRANGGTITTTGTTFDQYGALLTKGSTLDLTGSIGNLYATGDVGVNLIGVGDRDKGFSVEGYNVRLASDGDLSVKKLYSHNDMGLNVRNIIASNQTAYTPGDGVARPLIQVDGWRFYDGTGSDVSNDKAPIYDHNFDYDHSLSYEQSLQKNPYDKGSMNLYYKNQHYISYDGGNEKIFLIHRLTDGSCPPVPEPPPVGGGESAGNAITKIPFKNEGTSNLSPITDNRVGIDIVAAAAQVEVTGEDSLIDMGGNKNGLPQKNEGTSNLSPIVNNKVDSLNGSSAAGEVQVSNEVESTDNGSTKNALPKKYEGSSNAAPIINKKGTAKTVTNSVEIEPSNKTSLPKKYEASSNVAPIQNSKGVMENATNAPDVQPGNKVTLPKKYEAASNVAPIQNSKTNLNAAQQASQVNVNGTENNAGIGNINKLPKKYEPTSNKTPITDKRSNAK